MIETISPAVCGTRTRTLQALAFFAVGAFASAAALGVTVALIGARLPPAATLAIALTVAIAGMAREALVPRLRLPQRRSQVPERWHHDLPLPVWASGYGAGLGAGLLTYQPVATLVAALAAVAASGSVAIGVACLGAFAAGRVVGAAAPTAAVDLLAGLARPMRLVNAVALAALVVALGAPAALAATLPQFDPSVGADGTLAFSERTSATTSTVVIRPADGSPAIRIDGASSPSLSGELVAVRDADGVRILVWAAAAEVYRLSGNWSKPALEWPYLAVILTDGARQSLILVDVRSGKRRTIVRVPADDDLGRPSISAGTVVWHHVRTSGSRLLLARLPKLRPVTFLRSQVRLLTNPSRHRSTLVYVSQRNGRSRLILRRGRGRERILRSVVDPRVIWSTANDGANAWATLWNTDTGAASIVRAPY